MKQFIVTTTEFQAALVMAEILRIDPNAMISHRPKNRTVMRVQTARMSVLTLDAIPGVAQAIDTKDVVFLTTEALLFALA